MAFFLCVKSNLLIDNRYMKIMSIYEESLTWQKRFTIDKVIFNSDQIYLVFYSNNITTKDMKLLEVLKF